MEIYFGLRTKKTQEVMGVIIVDNGWDYGDGYRLCLLTSTNGAIPFLLDNKLVMKEVLKNDPTTENSTYEEPNHGVVDMDKLEIYEVDINPDKSQYQLRKRGEPKPK